MKLSTRNQLQGTVKAVELQGLMAKVVLDVGGQSIVAIITADAANELGLKVGDTASALIKSTSVMIAK
jgi:molybdopterin-binding protein